MNAITLFPLSTLLFPGVPLPLQIFEQRYLDLVSRCMKQNCGFGIVKLVGGQEVLNPARDASRAPAIVELGVYVDIVNWDQLPNGLLGISVCGERKFRVLESQLDNDQLLQAQVEFLPPEPASDLLQEYDGLLELLQNLRAHPSVAGLALPEVTDARQLGWQLAQVLPLELKEKLHLLQIDDPLARLRRLADIVDSLSKG